MKKLYPILVSNKCLLLAEKPKDIGILDTVWKYDSRENRVVDSKPFGVWLKFDPYAENVSDEDGSRTFELIDGEVVETTESKFANRRA